jgi:hypothetical protein
MREYFYYLRDGLKRPVVTVCLLKLAEHTRKNGTVVVSGSGDVIVRGVAICSDSDSLCRRRGRDIAKGRALKAFVRMESGSPVVRSEAKGILKSLPLVGLECQELIELLKKGKHAFSPILSLRERELTRDYIPTEAKS